jgi:bifunctional UDP-N-acetylglucosamine pyrophosphorylase / glucosamine-1-phosphate N-acetyltransferase
MSSRPDTVVILAAGQGTRMKSQAAKVLAPLCGRPMLDWVLDQALALEPRRVIVVVGHQSEDVRAASSAHPGVARLSEESRLDWVVQQPQRGTGHALQVALPQLGADPGRVVVLYGDMPLLSAESLASLCEAQAATGGGAAILTAEPSNPRGFGRIVRGAGGQVERIVEEKDASPEIRALREVNLGVYCFPGRELVRILPTLTDRNAQKELYLTDVVERLVGQGAAVRAVVLDDEQEAIGINTLAHLAEARRALQMRILERHLQAGVRITDPATTFVDHDVEIGAGTQIHPCTVILAGVRIGANCEVGPFATLRGGSELADGSVVGNFVEVNRSRLGKKSKAKHLAYLGDATLGERVNIGAGTIFANYDGKTKSPCHVGDGAFVGSGAILVAPVDVGAGATLGAGAVLKRKSLVGPGEVWVGVPAHALPRPKPPTS